MTTRETHPGGYPKLGLAARTLHVDASDRKALARRLERWEWQMGNGDFEARNLTRVRPDVAAEMVHVYVALRERYPSIKPEYMDFASRELDKSTLGTSLIYPTTFPNLRVAAEVYELDDIDELVDVVQLDADPEIVKMRRSVQREARWTGGVRDVRRSGAIDMSPVFAVRRDYDALVQYWNRRNELALAANRPRRVPELHVSAAAFVLIHEFGHLVDGELLADGYERGVDAYGAISAAVFNIDPPSPSAWRYHLINYPARFAPKHVQGPYVGDRARAAETKQRLRWTIGETLGSYAWNARDEIFAEAFALAHGAHLPLRQQLSGLLRELEATGLRRARLPKARTLRSSRR